MNKIVVDCSLGTVQNFDLSSDEVDEVNAALAAMPSQDEANIAALREVRNQRLIETDWWASSDLTMTAEQIAYRQALRDITNSSSSLSNVTWPTKP